MMEKQVKASKKKSEKVDEAAESPADAAAPVSTQPATSIEGEILIGSGLIQYVPEVLELFVTAATEACHSNLCLGVRLPGL